MELVELADVVEDCDDPREAGGRACCRNVALFGVEQKIRIESCTHLSISISVNGKNDFELLSYYTPTQRGHYHHGMFCNPTAAVNLFQVGKKYLTFWQAKAAVTRNLIGRKIISNVKRSDTRNSLHTVAFVKVD